VVFDTNIRASLGLARRRTHGNDSGYQSYGTTHLQVAPINPNQSPQAPALDAVLSDAEVDSTFVAELAEVLMDYRNRVMVTDTWGGGNSMGEALSTVCEALRHPDGYYLPSLTGPRIGSWLNASPRPNWIDTTENTDKNFVSFGCGIMFIYYLMSEFNFSIDAVIAAAGTTFEALFPNLTGTSGAWAVFWNHGPQVGSRLPTK